MREAPKHQHNSCARAKGIAAGCGGSGGHGEGSLGLERSCRGELRWTEPGQGEDSTPRLLPQELPRSLRAVPDAWPHLCHAADSLLVRSSVAVEVRSSVLR